MYFNKNPKRNPTSPRKNNDPVVPNFRLPPPPNISIPKINVGSPQNDNQPRPGNLIGLNPNNGTFSPVSQLYPQSNFDQEQLSFGFDMFLIDDNLPKKGSIITQNSPTQNDAQQNDDMFDQLNSILNDEISANKSNYSDQENILVQNPAYQNTDGQYLYNSLEQALHAWIGQLAINKNSRTKYNSTLLALVKLLDLYGIYNPSQKQIENYCNNYFKPDDHRNIRNFKSVSQRFFRWIQGKRIYNEIKPHTSITKIKPTSTPSMDYMMLGGAINSTLSRLINQCLKNLVYDDNTKDSFGTYIYNFIVFLADIPSLSPTVENMKTYFQNNLKSQPPSTINEYKTAIIGFLKFIEGLGVPQDHKVYDFLNSNQL